MIKAVNVNGASTSVPVEDEEARADIEALQTAVEGKADKDASYTKTEEDAMLAEKADIDDIPTDFYTKEETDEKLGDKADASSVYTKTETDNLLSNKADTTAIPTALSQLDEDDTHKVVTADEITAWDNKSDFSGKYEDLEGTPTIPTTLAELDDDSSHRTVTDSQIEAWDAGGTGGSSYPYQYSEGETVTTEDAVLQKCINAYDAMMSECKGYPNKIPFILQTDNHGSYPSDIYNLCAKMTNFAELSRVLTLGDNVYSYFNDSELTDFADKMKVFPVEKKVTLSGNHDAYTAHNSQISVEQAKLNPYLKNYDAFVGGKNSFFVSYDNYHKVKYIAVADYDVEAGDEFVLSGNLMSTEQANFVLTEMQKNDGYDIILISHCPFYNTAEDSVTLNTATDAGGSALMTHEDGLQIIPVLKAFKARSNGSYTDKSGVSHTYDFSGNTNNILLSMHGHTHPEGYYYLADGNLIYMFGSYKWGTGHPFYFGYIDKTDRFIKYWRVADNADNVVINVGLDGSAAVTGVPLDKSSVTVNTGTPCTLTATVSPVNASDKRVIWTSSDESIATVDSNGTVTGVKDGSASITVTTVDGGYTAKCSITVSSILPEGYTKCAYLMSHSTATSVTSADTSVIIDTLIVPTSNTGLYVKFSDLSVPGTDTNFIGTRIGSGDRFMVNVIGSGPYTMAYGFGAYTKTSISVNKADITSVKMNYLNDKKFDVNGNSSEITDTFSSTLPSFWLFGQQTTGSDKGYGYTYKIYEASITEYDEVVANFVPCLDTSGVPCMYDTVRQTSFYPSDTSKFTYEIG